MGLRELAEADLAVTLEDAASGFGVPLTFTAPDGSAAALTGTLGDTGLLIDPDTGQSVSGRQAHAVVRLSALATAFPGVELPKGVPVKTEKPWLVAGPDANGNVMTYKVIRSHPDRMLGCLLMYLGEYKSA